MFLGCSSLTSAPVLAATTLATNCYGYMFLSCSSLASAPALPVTALADSCYIGMFERCSSLSSAPKLPATILAANCYRYMFSGCSALKQAPDLPAATLADSCYYQMFKNCANLSAVKCGLTAWNGDATSNWLSGVAATGTFICPEDLGTDETIERGVSRCPAGWTVVNQSPIDYVPYVNVYGARLDTGFVPTATMSFRTVLSTRL